MKSVLFTRRMSGDVGNLALNVATADRHRKISKSHIIMVNVLLYDKDKGLPEVYLRWAIVANIQFIVFVSRIMVRVSASH